MEIAVSVKNLTKKYKLYDDKWGPIKEVLTHKKLHKEFLALNDVSIDFPKGESIGVLGKNGSGKSTLLKIITGIADPTAGDVRVDGSLVFLDVSSGIDAELSGYENIFMKGILLGYSKEEMMEKVEDIIEFSELGEFIHQPVKNYSSGMRSKLGFAISVNVDPDILIVDEALAVGDSLFREKCMNKMNEFKEKGKTIIFVSHDKHAVESFCSKAAWIHQGNLISYGDSKFVGSIYNDFMSGRKTLEAIKSEIQFHHSIEKVVYNTTSEGISLDLEGYLYSDNETVAKDFEAVLRDSRTGEYLSKPIIRKALKNHSMVPASQKDQAGFSVQFSEAQLAAFVKPGKYDVGIRYKGEKEEWTEFPLWAGQAEVMEDNSVQGPYKYHLKQESNKLFMTVDNHEKVQEQINKIWFDENSLKIEGVAFVRGYETDSEDDVKMEFHLINMETFEERVYPAEVSETEEITENVSFNPQGKKYNYSQFHVDLDIANIPVGRYECKLRYEMKNPPHHKMLVLAWASKHDQYPSVPYKIENKEIDVQTGSKYLLIEVKGSLS